jgi:glucose dehydrogenase
MIESPRPKHGLAERQAAVASQALLAIGGRLTWLLGAALLIWGLTSRESALYLAVSGFGLVLAGTLLAWGKRAGAWAYLFVVTITLLWAMRGVDHGGTPVAIRLVGPIALLMMISLLMPALRGWRVRRTLAVFSALLIGTLTFGISCSNSAQMARTTTKATELLATRGD